MLRTLTIRRLAQIAVFVTVPFALLLAGGCEHNPASPGGPGAAPGELATITVLPDPTSLEVGTTRQFTAVGRDVFGSIVEITPEWSVAFGGGSIESSSGLFTAGDATGEFVNTVRATSGDVFGDATVTVTTNVDEPAVSLGDAETYGILAGTEVTCISNGVIDADVGVSPGTAISGFPPCTLTGTRNAGNPAAAAAQSDLTTAFDDLTGMACGTDIVADLGGTTITPGVYCSASSVGLTGVLTLDAQGDPNADFVIQVGSDLTTAGSVNLINGADARNVWWVVGSSATLGTASQMKGNIIALTSITLVDGSTLLGRALARNGAVSLGTDNAITLP